MAFVRINFGSISGILQMFEASLQDFEYCTQYISVLDPVRIRWPTAQGILRSEAARYSRKCFPKCVGVCRDQGICSDVMYSRAPQPATKQRD